MSLNIQEIHQVAREAVTEGRKILLSYFGRLSKVEEKEQAGLVSEADMASELKISEALRSRLPDIPVLGEEASFKSKLDANTLQPGTRWILDPLDGTTNYIHSYHAYAISLALEWDGRLVYGIVDLPALQTTYHAMEGLGAYKNDQLIHVSHRKTLQHSLVATGFASSRPEVLKEQLKVFSRMVTEVRGIRRAGSAACDLCWVAEGIFDAYWENGLQAWDVAAGAVIVTEAGGKVSNYGTDSFNPYLGSVLATNGSLHQTMQGKLQV